MDRARRRRDPPPLAVAVRGRLEVLPPPDHLELLSRDLPRIHPARPDPLGLRARDAPQRLPDHRRHPRPIALPARRAHPARAIRPLAGAHGVRLYRGRRVRDGAGRRARHQALHRAPEAVGRGRVYAVEAAAATPRGRGLATHRERGHRKHVRGVRVSRDPHGGAAPLRAPARRALPRLRRCGRRAGGRGPGRRGRRRHARRHLDAARGARDPRPGRRRRLYEGGAERGGPARARGRLPRPARRGERYLDTIVGEACAEARANAPNPTPLIALVERTRQLSSR